MLLNNTVRGYRLPIGGPCLHAGRRLGNIGIASGYTPIVRGEADNGVVRNAELVQVLEYNSHGLIEQFHHSGIDWVVLELANIQTAVEKVALLYFIQAHLFRFCPVLFVECFGCLNGCMDGVVGEISKEGLIAVFLGFNKVGSFLTKPDGQGFSLGPLSKFGLL